MNWIESNTQNCPSAANCLRFGELSNGQFRMPSTLMNDCVQAVQGEKLRLALDDEVQTGHHRLSLLRGFAA